MTVYGRFAEDGSIDQEVDQCAVSLGKVLGRHAFRKRIGKRHFVRILVEKRRLITPDLETQWESDVAALEAVPAGEASPTEPNEEKPRSNRRKIESEDVTNG